MSVRHNNIQHLMKFFDISEAEATKYYDEAVIEAETFGAKLPNIPKERLVEMIPYWAYWRADCIIGKKKGMW